MTLRCPLCDGNISASEAGGFSCDDCHRSYPLIDGIPAFVDAESAFCAESYDSSAFEFLWQMEQKHFWHVGRKEIIFDVLRGNVRDLSGSRMLEVGCGNGNVLAYLEEKGVSIEGGDLFVEGLKRCRQQTNSPLYQVDILRLPFLQEYDVIGLFNVLEHIDRDEEALIQIRRALKPGGHLLCTVPAGKRLWSHKDISAHHCRRYEKAELVAKLNRNGFSVKRASYFVFLFYPVILTIRSISRPRGDQPHVASRASIEFKTMPLLNSMLLHLFRVERLMLKHMDLPFGVSLVALAMKENRKPP